MRDFTECEEVSHRPEETGKSVEMPQRNHKINGKLLEKNLKDNGTQLFYACKIVYLKT